MIAKKENLEKLLVLVKRIARDPENEWFKRSLLELRDDANGNEEVTEVNREHEVSGIWERKIDKMEEHLKIDGFELIDYTGVEDDKIRAQLVSDCIEMSRYRLGKVKEGISFEEFCRFAFYQIEGLLNYFYTKKFDSLDDIKSFIVKDISSDKIRSSIEGVTTVDQIPFYNKFSSFYYGFERSKKYWSTINDNLRKLRNDVSHRGADLLTKEDEVLQKALVIKEKPYPELTKSEKNTLKETNFIEFKRKKDFQHVLDELSAFSKDILENLAVHNS